jgi:hypothetical protein
MSETYVWQADEVDLDRELLAGEEDLERGCYPGSNRTLANVRRRERLASGAAEDHATGCFRG